MLTKGVAGSFLGGDLFPVFFEKAGVDFLIGATSGVSELFSFLKAVSDSCKGMLVSYRNFKFPVYYKSFK